ncbi:RNA decapping enzyme [Trypanosoma brucei equiperdum]|uniref:RNA decapping enzyme n=1 Tax=Trypanosoma brucei equiperdum TaxID=630700 RepID=A0A3L6L8V4_9TRYP|nr:RNA decapping enzyme [Trypanosoma brucei equiperdum]
MPNETAGKPPKVFQTNGKLPRGSDPTRDDVEFTCEGEVVVTSSDGKKFRRSVCVFIMNENGHFLGCRRYDDRSTIQCVQGGAKRGETVQQTAAREVMEEIGVHCDQLQFISEITYSKPECGEPQNCDGPRSAFRYKSKSWRRIGIVGQELYPLLYSMQSSVINHLNFHSVQGTRQEFIGAEWVPLHVLRNKCSKSKQVAVSNMCDAVEEILWGQSRSPRRDSHSADAGRLNELKKDIGSSSQHELGDTMNDMVNSCQRKRRRKRKGKSGNKNQLLHEEGGSLQMNLLGNPTSCERDGWGFS